jgi:hypothetical protein
MIRNHARQRLDELINALPPGKIDLLAEMARALNRTVVSTVDPASDLVNEEFNEDFSGRLLLFHAMHDAALTKKTFEYFFCGASRAAGRDAKQTENDVHPGEDVVVNEVRFSLKTEGGKSISPSALQISKLMEARWIRECRTGDDFCRLTRERVFKHLQHYERIITLRSFQTEKHVSYQLVEIPRALLERVDTLRPSDFSARTASGSSGATVVDPQGRPLWVLSLDGSVEKVTVRNLDIKKCRVHSCWRVVL